MSGNYNCSIWISYRLFQLPDIHTNMHGVDNNNNNYRWKNVAPSSHKKLVQEFLIQLPAVLHVRDI